MNHFPNTIEECVEAMEHLFQKHGDLENVPFEDAIAPTHRLYWDLLNRILIIEQKLEGMEKNK